MTSIPFLDLHRQYLSIAEEIKNSWEEVLTKAAFAGGPFVQQFENSFATYCETPYASGLNSGTSALHLAMLALGIGEGDEVILPANTFIATAWGITYCGAKPVFVDCDEYYNIDVKLVEKAITPFTKAIVGVHLYGQPCKVDVLRQLADRFGLFFIEDAAQAHGARFNGKRVGGLSDIAAFSFYPGKNLGAYGEGGGVTSQTKEYIDHINRLRNHGCDVRYYHKEVGFNMRMDGLQGAVLSVKLKYLDQWNERRRSIATQYLQQITNSKIKLPLVLQGVEPVWHLFVVTVDDRDGFIEYLNNHNIQSALHYPVPCHLQEAYKDLHYNEGDMPNAEYLSRHCVSLPMFAELTDAEVEYVIQIINQY